MKSIKNIMIILCLLLTTQLASQTDSRSFKVVSTGTVPSSEIHNYELAIVRASIEQYRFETKSNILVFDTGIEIELKSAKECYLLGINIKPSNYDDYRDPQYTDPIFHLVVSIGMPQAPDQKPYLIALYKRVEK